ncbi:MAG: CDP-archaeol synthase, partial [Patescibacteria group bacterium]
MTLFLTTLWLLIPAGIANMVPVLVARVPFLDIPIDGALTWRGHRITGDHKTVRGFVFGTAAGALTSYIEYLIYPAFAGLIAVDYAALSPVLLGFALGLGALLGDSVKSFFKRQIGV